MAFWNDFDNDDHPGPPPRRRAFIQEIPETPDCGHAVTKFTVYTASNGVKTYGHQCTKCGDKVGKFVGMARAIEDGEQFDPNYVPAFDNSIRQSYWRLIQSKFDDRETARKLHEERQHREWVAWYHGKYLPSKAWSKKRAAVLKRCNFTCEGCGQNEATQVHHLTYDNVGYELLFQLVGVCRWCHEKIHGRGE